MEELKKDKGKEKKEDGWYPLKGGIYDSKLVLRSGIVLIIYDFASIKGVK